MTSALHSPLLLNWDLPLEMYQSQAKCASYYLPQSILIMNTQLKEVLLTVNVKATEISQWHLSVTNHLSER